MSAGYEKKDVSLKGIVITAMVSIVVVIIAVIAATEYYNIVREKDFTEYAMKPVSDKLINLRSREKSQLNHYAVIDEEKGIYQIPVKEAMHKIAKSY